VSPRRPNVVAIVPAAGGGDRLGLGIPKAFVDLDGEPIFRRAVRAALSSDVVSSVVVAVPAGFETEADAALHSVGPHAVVVGGATRQSSVRLALAVVAETADIVVCHDAARPFAVPELFDAVVAGLDEADGVVPGVPIPDTVKRVQGDVVTATEPRDGLVAVQTPQAFRAPVLRDAHRRAEATGLDVTDDAAVIEWAGYRVRVVPGDPANFKVTTAQDLARAEAVLRGSRGAVA
jgi:2-C-methyl-D-erythritol 4-phosphate cytidylyltransferase